MRLDAPPEPAADPLAADAPLLKARGVTGRHGARTGCEDVSFALRPGEAPGIVGESGSGKTAPLGRLAGRLASDAGEVVQAHGERGPADVLRLPEARRRASMRTERAFVSRNPSDGLGMTVGAGADDGERPRATGARHCGGSGAPRSTGWRRWRSRGRGSATGRRRSPAACSGGCRSRAVS